MSAITRYEFDGRVFDARVINEDEWFTAEQVADMLGHKNANSVLCLFRDHKSEFLPHETCEMLAGELSSSQPPNSEKPKRRGNPQIKVRLFSIAGVEHLALLSKKPGVRLRRWCVELRGRFRRRESAEISREQYDRMVQALADKDRAAADKDKLLSAFATAASVSISAAAKVMGKVGGVIRQSPEIKALMEEKKREIRALEALRRPLPLIDGGAS